MIRCKDYIKQELNRLESTLHCLPTTSIFYQLFWLLPKNSNATMFFSSTLLLPLFMLAATSAYGQQFQDPENQAPASTSTELDTSEPTLWQMAAFAARQMSTKTRRFKLATLTSAEQTDSLFRLKVTLQRVNQGAPIDSKDLLFCTVEVRTNSQGQEWVMENFGCTLPAVVRRRRPAKKVAPVAAAPVQEVQPAQTEAFELPQPKPQPQSLDTSYKYLAPVSNSISDEQEVGNGLDDQPKRQYKRQTAFRQSSFFPQFVQYRPQPYSRYQYLPVQSQYQPMSFRYQAYY